MMKMVTIRSILALVINMHVVLQNQCVCGVRSIALHKPSSQSSYLKNGMAYNASLGNDGNQEGLSCIHTANDDTQSWWMVDLGANHKVDEIGIKNSETGQHDNLKNFSVEVTTVDPHQLEGFPGPTNVGVCFKNASSQSPRFIEYKCVTPVLGRYVRLVMANTEGRPLNFCELAVYELNPLNLASLKPSSQSSTVHSFLAKRGNDGRRYGKFTKRSCSHTAYLEPDSWWMVDLEETVTVGVIGIMNRVDCCSRRLKNFSVEVTMDDPRSLKGFPKTTGIGVCFVKVGTQPPEFQLFKCDNPVSGRYVRVVMENSRSRPLTICELEVYKWNGPNLALLKSSKQSSSHKAYIARNANDGIRYGLTSKIGWCIQTIPSDYKSWWMVDLGENYKVAAIGIMNRVDCCSGRLKNFSVEITVANPVSLKGFPGPTGVGVCFSRIDAQPPTFQEYQCQRPVMGRYVRLTMPNNERRVLNICELEVYEWISTLADKISTWQKIKTIDWSKEKVEYDNTCSLND